MLPMSSKRSPPAGADAGIACRSMAAGVAASALVRVRVLRLDFLLRRREAMVLILDLGLPSNGSTSSAQLGCRAMGSAVHSGLARSFAPDKGGPHDPRLLLRYQAQCPARAHGLPDPRT